MDKHRLKHELWLRFVGLLNILLLTIPFAVCWYGSYAGDVSVPLYRAGEWMVVALFAILYILFGRTYDVFAVSDNRFGELVYSQGLTLLFSDGVMYIVISLLSAGCVNALPLLLTFFVQLLLAAGLMFAEQKFCFAVFPAERTVIVCDGGHDVNDLVREHGLSRKFEILTTVTSAECLTGNMRVFEGVTVVFICGVDSRTRNVILKYCIEHNIRVFVLPRVGDVIMSGAKRKHMFHLPFLQAERYNPPMEYLICKRLFDLLISVLLLVLTSPIVLITAIAIKAEDGGPVLYRQRRLTKDGKEFMILKFRSMCVDAEKAGGAQLSSGDDDERVTKVGRLIREIRVDELPQIWNILCGDMSIVGPRPERPELAARYTEELPEFKLRLQAKAGLTGYAQVYGKYETTPYDKLQMDLMYIANPSLMEDLRIIVATVKILFLPGRWTE